MIGKAILAVILALVLQFVCKVIYRMDYHVHRWNHSPGPCRLLPGIEHGAEDMQTLSDGLTFISSGYKSNVIKISDEQLKKRKGKIFTMNLQKPEENPKELKLSKGFDASTFHPHGLGVWKNQKTDEVTLFVINHHPKDERIEKFIYDPKYGELVHVKTYTDPSMAEMNDVVAISDNSFYFTNLFFSPNFYLRYLDLFFLNWGNVVYFDGSTYKVAAEGIGMANGIIMSSDEQYIYLIHGTARELGIYSRRQDNTLKLEQAYPLYSSADNPTVDLDTGDVWVGSHAVLYKTMKHLRDPTLLSPSQVLKLIVEKGKVTDASEVYYDDGSQLSGSSVATRYKNQLLVGTVYGNVLQCELKALPPH